MNRRTFLKGLLAVTGAATLSVLGVDGVEAVLDEIIVPEREILVPARSYGSLGAIRFNDKWFSLDDATFMMHRKFAPLMHFPHPTIPNHRGLAVGMGTGKALVESSFEGQFFVRESPYDLMEFERGNIEIEIDSRYACFKGEGYLESIGSELLQTPEMDHNQLFEINLESTQIRRI